MLSRNVSLMHGFQHYVHMVRKVRNVSAHREKMQIELGVRLLLYQTGLQWVMVSVIELGSRIISHAVYPLCSVAVRCGNWTNPIELYPIWTVAEETAFKSLIRHATGTTGVILLRTNVTSVAHSLYRMLETLHKSDATYNWLRPRRRPGRSLAVYRNGDLRRCSSQTQDTENLCTSYRLFDKHINWYSIKKRNNNKNNKNTNIIRTITIRRRRRRRRRILTDSKLLNVGTVETHLLAPSVDPGVMYDLISKHTGQ